MLVPTVRVIPLLAGLGVSLLAACAPKAEPPTAIEPPAVSPFYLQPTTPKLPLLSITTADGSAITSKLVYVPATLTLSDTAGATLVQGAMEVRGRGNSTWGMPKKPYRLKLAASTSLLGMPANRHWVLLANYSDKTLLRNDLTFAFSRMLGMAWTPRAEFVEVTLNGAYQGVYQLTEHVRIAPDRVNIPSLKVTDTTGTNLTGGYLLEVDERRGEAYCFNSTMTRMVWCVNDPDVLLDAGWERQRAYITNYIARTDSALFGPRFTDPDVGYAAFIDVESAVNNYILQEVVKNVDGSLRFGPFFHKPRGGRLVFGPVWDFDLAIGNVNYDGADQTVGWRARDSEWYTRLFEDPAFRARVAQRYATLKGAGVLDSLQRLVFSRANYLQVAQGRNFARWPILGTWVWPNRVVTGSYEGETIALKLWLADRIKWVDGAIAK